jgi:hypothetical protein
MHLWKSLKSSKEGYTQIAEQIHEILTAIIVLYETTQIQGVVPPALLSDVVNFTEYVLPEALCLINDTFQNPGQNTCIFESKTRGKTQATAQS